MRVAIIALNCVCVCDEFDFTIFVFVGVVTRLAGSTSSGSDDGTGSAATFYNPSGIAVDTVGVMYVADSDNHLIRKISPAGEELEQLDNQCLATVSTRQTMFLSMFIKTVCRDICLLICDANCKALFGDDVSK